LATIGTHCIVELYECPRELLDDEHFVRNAVREATSQGLATLVDEVAHHFEPHGVTALGLLAESHIAVHTWPEYGYAAADIFTCGHTADPHRACDHLVRAFRAGRFSLTTLARGAELEARPIDRAGHVPAAQPGAPA